MDVQEVRNSTPISSSCSAIADPRRAAAEEDDSAEVYIGEEFIGELIVDDEDDERSYNFGWSIQVEQRPELRAGAERSTPI